MAKKVKANISVVSKINVRMYRVGTGDFFLLQLKKGNKVTFNLMIDCGCIHGGKADFEDKVMDLSAVTGGIIDLLIVTHEHADHINGFDKASALFDAHVDFKKVWFAWTEGDDKFANAFRKEHAKVKMAIDGATKELSRLWNKKAFSEGFSGDQNEAFMLEGTEHFITTLEGLNELNQREGLAAAKIPTMEDILRRCKVIKKDTMVEFLEPGKVVENLSGAEGIRFYVLAPPKENDYIKREEISGEGYEKRKKPSSLEMNFLNVFDPHVQDELVPFHRKYLLADDADRDVSKAYELSPWRRIDHDWLYSAGALALRHESSINNTSLAVAIQFIDSERVLLFPGDAEQGSWLSWHDKLKWAIKDKDGKSRQVDATYLLGHTVFYKVSHHLSQNGTPKRLGLELMKQDDFAAMVTLDFKKINTGWLNTMPNDLIGEELLRKTKGKLFFVGDRKKILNNINTSRVSISKANLDLVEKYNKVFDGSIFIDYEVLG